MKKEESKILYLMKIILLTMFCMLCLVAKSVYAAENGFVADTENSATLQSEDTPSNTGISTYGMTATNVEYSTEGGTWTKINDTTFTMDKDGDGTTDVSLVKNGNEWQYSFTVADDKATYYGWEENVPDGYEVVGAGTRANPAVNTMIKYSHTPNISDDGVKNGNYANNLNLNDVVNIPGASKLHVALTYAGESANYDYVCAWVGSQPGYTASSNSSSAISVSGTQKFGGGNGATVEFDVEGDTVTFGYRSDGSGCGNGYGYYAVVTGSGGGLKITNKSKTNPAPETGAIELTKKTAGKGTMVTRYSHTANVSDDGVQNGNYANNLNTNEVITIPGASQLHIVLKYAGESESWDWVSVWAGNHPDYTASGNYSSGITVNEKQKFGGGSGTTVEFDVTGDSVTFGFKSDSSGCGNGFGYYAVVTGSVFATTQTQYFKFNINLSTDDANLAKFIAGDKMYGETAFKDGSGLVYLESGDSVILDGIPSGINYTITEEPNSDYSVSWAGTSGSGSRNVYSGTIAANTTHEITCTNAYKRTTSGGSTTINPVEYGTMKLSKQFVNATGNKNSVFHIAFWNLETNTHYKYSDGINENNFVSDSTGLADVTLNITDNHEFTFSNLPVGCKYQISEEASDYIASYEISGAAKITQQRGENLDVNQSLTTAKEIISKDDDTVVAFKNTGKEIPKEDDKAVDVYVKKEWDDNDNAAGIRPDSITIQLLQDDDVIATAVLDKDTDWKTEFTDLDRYHEDGKTEYEYEVTESDVEGYTMYYEKTIGKKILEDGSISPRIRIAYTLTNSIEESCNLKISKTVKGDNADPAQKFYFTVRVWEKGNGDKIHRVFKLDNKQGTKTGTIAFDENGEATFALKNGESIFIKDIPCHTLRWQVKETIPEGYTEEHHGWYEGSAESGNTVTVNVVNTYNPSHKMTITKMVKGNQGDKTKQFKFQIMLTGNNIPASLDYTKNVQAGSMTVKNGIAEFTLGHGDMIVFDKMPAGVKYVITELDGESNGYTVESKNASGTVDSDKTVEFTNTKNVGIPTAAVTNTAAIAGVVVICMIGVVVMIIKKKKKAEK